MNQRHVGTSLFHSNIHIYQADRRGGLGYPRVQGGETPHQSGYLMFSADPGDPC